MRKMTLTFCIVALWVFLSGLSAGSDFADTLISYSGPFGSYPYDQPGAVLGPPTPYVRDTGKNFPVSLVYGAWNVTPEGGRTVLTLGSGSEVIVGFNHIIADDINNPHGIDFIVFSNTFFERQWSGANDYLTPTTDMNSVYLTHPASINDEWVTVSVAQDPNGPWFTFPEGIVAGGLFPTQAFAWDSVSKQWGKPLDFLRPVDPTLTLADFAGLSVPEAIALYDGSAGGAGFDLRWLDPNDYDALRIDPETGRRWFKYVKLTSDEWGEVDAIADVAACGDYKHPFPPGDIDRDCRVDLADFAVLAENWMTCTWNCDP